MVYVGMGLPPIPRRIVEKIQNNEFVDFTELPPAKGKSRVSPPQGDGQIVVVQAADLIQSRKVIPDLATWMQCFTIYVAVRAAYQPHKLADLMGYRSLIARPAKHLSGSRGLFTTRIFGKRRLATTMFNGQS